MKPTDEDFKLFETIEKWKVISALSGIDASKIWDYDNDETELMLEKLENIETYNAMLADGGVALQVAQTAIRMGISTSALYQYHQYQEELVEEAALAALLVEEANNKRLKKLRDIHRFKMVDGPSEHQIYWEFSADFGQGLTLFKCRHVRVSWFTQRIWCEWTDAAGEAHKDKLEFGGMHFVMDREWPTRWQQNYNRNFAREQIPYAYTHEFIVKHTPKKVKNARKSNSTV